jgi:hypothetical protein
MDALLRQVLPPAGMYSTRWISWNIPDVLPFQYLLNNPRASRFAGHPAGNGCFPVAVANRTFQADMIYSYFESVSCLYY